MWIVDGLSLQPIHEIGKILRDFVSDEYTVDHVAAKQSHLYLISKMWLDTFVLVNGLEDVGGC